MKEQAVILTGTEDYKNVTLQVGNRIEAQLSFAQQTVPFYGDLYSGLTTDEINHQRLYQIPKATPQNLLENPTGFVSKEGEPVQISSSGGTYGRRKIIYRTTEDLQKSALRQKKCF